MSLSITNYESPIGPIEIHATDTAVSRVEFAGEQSEESEEQSGEKSTSSSSSPMPPGAHPLLDEVQRQLDAYFAGDLRCFDLPLGLDGTPFQRQVWHQLLSVGYGHTASYQDNRPRHRQPQGRTRRRRRQRPQSRRHHRPLATASSAAAARPKLTGYGGGLWRKEWLLRHEGVLLV